MKEGKTESVYHIVAQNLGPHRVQPTWKDQS